MNLIITIAWRNILRHKGKSIIIGVILFLGALIMTVGNGVISGMDRGLQKHIVNGFTGDAIIVSDKQDGDNVLLEFMGRSVEPIYNFKDIDEFLSKQNFVERYLPAGKNTAMLLNDEGGAPGYTYLIGVEFDKYKKMFPDNITAVEGIIPEKTTGPQFLMTTGARKEFFETSGIWFISHNDTFVKANLPEDAQKEADNVIVKDSVVLMGINGDNSTADLRMGVDGVVRYNALNTILGHFIILDIESYRRCLGYFAAEDMSAQLPESKKKLLSMDNDNLDDLFGGEGMLDEPDVDAGKDLTGTATSVAPTAQTSIDDGAYNVVFVRFKGQSNPKQSLAALNDGLKKAGLGVRAVGWKSAIGAVGSMASVIKGALFMFVMFLFFVAIIIIMNTLSMAAIERTSEIGMMRAVGARKGFIRMMFLGETAALSIIFGGAGIAAGIATVYILTALNLTTSNDMIQLLYGGDTFRPLLSIFDLILVIVQLVIVSVIAVLYPIKVAGSITPLDAVSRE